MDSSSFDSNINEMISKLRGRKRLSFAQEIQLAQLVLESDKTKFEREKLENDKKFWSKNFVAVITAIISLTAVVISFMQVWSNYIQREKEIVIKDKEIQLAELKSRQESIIAKDQLIAKQKSDALGFISDNKQLLIDSDKKRMDAFADIISQISPDLNIERTLSMFVIEKKSTANLRQTFSFQSTSTPEKISRQIAVTNSDNDSSDSFQVTITSFELKQPAQETAQREKGDSPLWVENKLPIDTKKNSVSDSEQSMLKTAEKGLGCIF